MSRIDDLIAAQCSDGVEFKAIESLVLRPANIRWADQGDAEFQYIDLTSVDRVTHAIAETSTITSENAPSRAQQIVREGDVIFGTTRPMLKRYAVIPREFDGQICSTGFCVLRPDNNIVLTNFLFHLIGTDDFYAYVEANERGASYQALRTAPLEFENVRFVVTDVAEQLVPDRPFTIEPPASQGLEADLPAFGEVLFGHHGVAHLFFSKTDAP